MKVGIVRFPGSNCDFDMYYAIKDTLGFNVNFIWHKSTQVSGYDYIILPGGFSFGDYLRCGAIARFSPVMKAVIDFAQKGGRLLGICNGFQILCEAGLLPGALIRNIKMRFICNVQALKVENSSVSFNQKNIQSIVHLPVAHGEGNYYIDDEGLKNLQANNQILLRYEDNPNGSLSNIAGIRNKEGTIFGMMPHPERAVDKIHPNQSGIGVLKALLTYNE